MLMTMPPKAEGRVAGSYIADSISNELASSDWRFNIAQPEIHLCYLLARSLRLAVYWCMARRS